MTKLLIALFPLPRRLLQNRNVNAMCLFSPRVVSLAYHGEFLGGKESELRNDQRKNLEETYEQLSRSQKTIVIASALGRVFQHWLSLIPLRWILMQIRIDMRMKAPR